MAAKESYSEMRIFLGPACGIWPCARTVVCDSRSSKIVHKITTFMEGGDHIFHHSLTKTLGLFLEIGKNVNFSMEIVD